MFKSQMYENHRTEYQNMSTKCQELALDIFPYVEVSLSSPDESELLDKMPLVMRTAIAVDINLTTFQKIALFQVSQQSPRPPMVRDN